MGRKKAIVYRTIKMTKAQRRSLVTGVKSLPPAWPPRMVIPKDVKTIRVGSVLP